MQKKENCGYCRGSGEQVCKTCGGSRNLPCMNLSYISIIGAPIRTVMPCHDCNGRGMIMCPYCHGTGKKQ